MKHLRAWLMGNRFTVLLCALMILVFASPIADVVRKKSPGLFSQLLVLICLDIMLLSALFAISRSRRQLITAALLSVPGLILQIVDTFYATAQIRGCGYLFTIVFLGYVIVLIIKALFRQRTVNANIICASLCAYLLIGLLWAFIYSLIEIFLPGSFSISDAHLDVSRDLNVTGAQSGFAIYYSLITLSTLGYGDVIAVNPISRAFAYSEAVIGQIYLAVLVARLVGLQISQTLLSNTERGRKPPQSQS